MQIINHKSEITNASILPIKSRILQGKFPARLIIVQEKVQEQLHETFQCLGQNIGRFLQNLWEDRAGLAALFRLHQPYAEHRPRHVAGLRPESDRDG